MNRFRSIAKVVSYLILVLAFLSLFGASVMHIVLGGDRLGIFGKPLLYLVSFPSKANAVFNELFGPPPTYEEIDSTFEEVNRLNYDVYALNSFLSSNKNQWEVRLFNLRNDSVIHTWYIGKDSFSNLHRQFKNSAPLNGILLPGRSIIIPCAGTNNLYRLDEHSNIVWYNDDRLFHHAQNLAADDNIWICTRDSNFVSLESAGPQIGYLDDAIAKVDSRTGQVLFEKSLSEIFIENGYASFLHGFTNDPYFRGDDPFHLNDIQPALSDAKFWKKDDLFLSLRHRSLVMQYRPQSGKIIRMLYGPFINQHDVDLISESEMLIFNNNVSAIGQTLKSENSELLSYNFEDSSFRKLFQKMFQREEIFTLTQGSYELLSTGDVYVESQNSGRIYIFNEKELLLKKTFRTSATSIERPHGMRIYEKVNF